MKPHDVPSQVAVPLAGGVQAAHAVDPQLLTSALLTQFAPHRWKPALQTKPHEVPLHVAVALAGAVHGEQELPHELVLLLLSQAPPQR